MDTFVLDTAAWARENFSECFFNDQRLTKRLVQCAELCANRPNDSTPHQAQKWSDCKAMYRLMDNKKVSFQAIIEPHCKRTRSLAQEGIFLSICDTTELSFSLKRKIDSLGKTGDNFGQGFFLHSSLLKCESTGEILGLAAQDLSYRIPAIKGETKTQRLKRARNSEVWGRVVQAVGQPLANASIIHVCDRGADHYEFYTHCQLQRSGWVARVQHINRRIVPAQATSSSEPAKGSETLQLMEYLKAQPVAGTYELKVATAKKRPARTVLVEVRVANVWVPRPMYKSPWLKTHGPKFIKMGVVLAEERISSSTKTKSSKSKPSPLQWVLYTHELMQTFDDAWRVLERYEQRWIIEEYHKAAKTGCQIENRYYRKNKRLERVAGLLSVLAVRIVAMKEIGKSQPNRKAAGVIPKKWLIIVCKIHRQRSPKARQNWIPSRITVSQFIRGLAMIGGFLGRKHDGDPGWITIWRGVKELMILLKAQKLLRTQEQIKRCG